jgi:molybdate transport system substrate-binding protein
MKILATILLCLALASARAADVHVFAAASLTDAMKAIAAKYEPASGDKLLLNFAASNALTVEIIRGAPADVILSADEAQMARLASKSLIDGSTRRDLLSNKLVAVVPSDSKPTINAPADLAAPSIQRLALGDPAAVPAGVYAKEYLRKAGLWDKLAPRVIPCASVRAALAAVEGGNVDAGIVYQTDAKISYKVKVAFVFPDLADLPITYPVALVQAAPQPDAAKKFLAYLEGPEAAAIFTSYGFIVIPHRG